MHTQIDKQEIAFRSLIGMIVICVMPVFFYQYFTHIISSFALKVDAVAPEEDLGKSFEAFIAFWEFFKLSPIILGFYYLLSYMILYFAWKKDKKIYDFVFEMMIACMLYLFAQSFFILIQSKLKFAYDISYALSNQISSIANLCFVLLFFYTWFKISQMEIKK